MMINIENEILGYEIMLPSFQSPHNSIKLFVIGSPLTPYFAQFFTKESYRPLLLGYKENEINIENEILGYEIMLPSFQSPHNSIKLFVIGSPLTPCFANFFTKESYRPLLLG